MNHPICCKLHNDTVEKSEKCYIAQVRFFLYTGFMENLFLINLNSSFLLYFHSNSLFNKEALPAGGLL